MGIRIPRREESANALNGSEVVIRTMEAVIRDTNNNNAAIVVLLSRVRDLEEEIERLKSNG